MLNFYLNGWLHGPVHIMIGGHWAVDKRLGEAISRSEGYGADLVLLLSKYVVSSLRVLPWRLSSRQVLVATRHCSLT